MGFANRSGASLFESLQNDMLAIAEIGANRLLGYDDDALAGCGELQGRVISLEITDLEFETYCHPGAWGIRLSSDPPPREVDARISGRLVALIELVTSDDQAATSMRERVRFDGDVAVAQKLQRILAALEIDWEEILADYTGDRIAFQLHQGLRRVGERLRGNLDSILMTSSEFLREEARLTPTGTEFDRFAAGVTRLKHDVARSEARLRALIDRLDDSSA